MCKLLTNALVSENVALIRQLASLLMVSLIHHLATAIVHCLLLQLKLPVPFTNRHTIWYWAIICLALSGVDLKKGPDPFTDIASAICLDLAPRSMLK